MFRHVVMFRLSNDAAPGAIDAIRAGLDTLPPKIPEIESYVHGPDVGAAPTNFDYVVVADFASAEAFAAYRDHPDHQQLIAEQIVPNVSDRAAVQYET